MIGDRAMTTTTPLAGRAASDADYQRLGLSRDTVAPWEDGARTDGGRGSFEWWYFDAHLDDGAALVVMFMDKDFTEPRLAATLAGFDGAYLRFGGECRVQYFRAG